MDTSLPSVVYVEGKLGIALASAKHLLRYALSEFREIMRSKPGQLDQYLQSHSTKLNSLTRAILLVKGDISSALTCRKMLIRASKGEVSSSAKREIGLSSVLLNKHPKHANCWLHRRWCLAHSSEAVDIAGEVALCTHIAQNTPKNYYTWVHRLWILQFMNRQQVRTVSEPYHNKGI